jgi:Extensin-like protein C-terminus
MSFVLITPLAGRSSVHHFTSKKFICAIALLMGSALALKAETVPLPRDRPPILEDQSSAPKIESERSPCQLQLAEIAEFKPEPPITGPGECTATDVVNVSAVLLPDNHRVVFSPIVTLQCSMAEVVAHWIRDDVAPTLDTLGLSLRGVETLESFGCRSFNGISGAKLSEHGHANALDVRSLKLANGTVIELTNATVSKALREQLRQTACTRFSTVLGDGADAYHENHVHIDLMKRTNNYKICQWNVLDPAEIAALAAKNSAAAVISVLPATTQSNGVPVPRPRPLINTETSDPTRQSVHQGPQEGTMRSPHTSSGAHPEEQTVTVGPWTISTAYIADNFDGCAMSRSTEGIDITFRRTPDGLLLFLQSQKWNLERGKAYTIRLMAGSRSVEAKALAELKAVTIALVDRSLNEKLRTADVLDVRGEGATLRVPLDGSTAALKSLDVCFDKDSRAGIDTNPFVSPTRKP